MFNANLNASVDELEQALLAWESMISQLRQQQAKILASLDVMQVNRMDGARSLHEWTRARLDVSAHTARNLLDAARSLPDQPQLADLATSGASFERLVATSRLVSSGASEETITRSSGFDLGGVVKIRNRHRRLNRNTERDIFTDRHLHIQDSLDGTRGRIHSDLPGFEHRIVTKALEERADMFADLPGPTVGKRQRLADAFVSIAQDSLELPTPDGEMATHSEPLATILVDGALAATSIGEAGAEIEFGPKVGPAVLERILCTGRVQLVGIANGKPVATSDGTRAIPPAIRRFVAWRDGGCTINGCHSRYRLQPHHIRERANGGDNDPENLTTLCWFHHHVVAHGMGFRLDPESPPQRRRFLRKHTSGVDPP